MEFEQSFAFEIAKGKEEPDATSDSDPSVNTAARDEDEMSEEPEQAGENERDEKTTKQEKVKTEPLKRNAFFEKPSNEETSLERFESLNLSKPLLKACSLLKYERATPIQAAAIPLVLSGRDICGSAITGSGKTAAFALPLLERLLYRPSGVAATYVLIISPTRELAVQIHGVIKELAKFTNIQAALIVGGFSLQVQSATLDARPEIVVGTPGRLIDHLRNSRSFDLDDVHAVVLDEADKLLKMGFINEIKEILRYLPKKRQTMLFSATMTEEVKKLMQLSLHQPVRIAADPSGRVPRKLVQEIIRIKGEDMRKQKEAILCALCSRAFAEGHAIVFCATKSRAHRIKLLFDMLKLPATDVGELHSSMSQSARLDSLEKFRNNEFSFLVATDVAGRGLDIAGVETVINYDAPQTLDTYLHRIGRTARAGAKGQAVTFINDTNRALLKEIISATKQQLVNRILPTEVIAYYEQQLQLHQRHLKLIEKKEHEDEHLARAEMEVERASNVIEHEKEILSKPPRTWFQTKEQRREMQKLARMEDDGLLGKGGLFSVRSEDEVPAKKGKMKLKKGEQMTQSNSEMAETNAAKGTIRAFKQYHRLFESRGFTSWAADRHAHESMRTAKGNKKRSFEADDEEAEGFLDDRARTKRKKKHRERIPSSDLLTDEPSRTARVYSGGARSGRLITDAFDKKKKNLLKRGGKGKHAFKGKSKYKRR